MEENWWKFPHYVQLDLEEEELLQEEDAPLFPFHSLPSFSPVSYSPLTDFCMCVGLYTSSFQLESYLRAFKKGRSEILRSMQERGCRNTCTDHIFGIFPPLSYCTHSSFLVSWCHFACLFTVFASKRHEVSINVSCFSAAFSMLSIILWWFLPTNQEAIEMFSLWTLWVWSESCGVPF